MRSHAKASSAGSTNARRRGVRSRAILLVLALCALVACFSAPAQAAPSHAELPALSHETGLNTPCGVTTDAAGYLYVANFDFSSVVPAHVNVYSPSGAFVTEFPTGATQACPLEADASGNVYAISNGDKVVRYKPSKYPPSAGDTTYSLDTTLNGTGTLVSIGARAMAVNPASGNVAVSEAGVNEVQTVTRTTSGGTIGGTYKLCRDAAFTECTGPIATGGNANTVVKPALESLYGAGNVAVSGSGTGPRNVTFTGALASQNLPQMFCDGAALTSTVTGATTTCTINTAPGLVEGVPSHVSIYEPNGTLVSNTTGSGVVGASYYGVDVYGSNGRVYAVDKAHGKALLFEAGAAAPIVQIDGSEAPTGAFSGMASATPLLAVDQSNGNVLVSDVAGHGVVDEFNAAGKYVTQITHTPAFSEAFPADVDYDDSATANKGNVYVSSDIAGKLYAFGPLSPQFNLTVSKEGSGTGAAKCDIGLGAETCLAKYAEGTSLTLTATPEGVGVVFAGWQGCESEPSGNCKVSFDAAENVKATFIQTGPPTVTTEAASGLSKTGATLNGKVNPNGLSVTECKFEYGLTTSYTNTAACVPSPGSGGSAVSVSATIGSLVADTTYHFRLVATNSGGTVNGGDQQFKTPNDAPPTVTTTAGATGITQSTANVAGTVNPNGTNVSACKVEYGTTTSYGSEKPCASLPGSGTSPVAVSASLSLLAANQTYHFRFVATNTGGTVNGEDQTFTTLVNAPTVATTAGATSITQTGATVAGTVNPNSGNVTACKVKYGLTTAYGSEADCASLPGSGSSPVAVSKGLTGLTANTTYHFKFVATNAGGTGEGTDQTFTTLPNAPSVVTTAGATSITQTGATVAGTVNPNSGNVTACKVKYGLTTAYGSEADCASLPGSGSSPVAVSKGLTGLTANTTYHFKFVATNAGGTGEGTDQTFTTLVNAPVVTSTAGATEITQATAKVAGTVNPNSGNVSACKVEYGTTSGYGSEKACNSLPGSGSVAVGVSASLTGLTANTTYHFRVVATNPGGTTNGSDQTFATLPNAPAVTTAAGATSIAQTGATVAGTVNPNSGNVSKCEVEYGTTTSYGSKKSCASLPGAGSSPVAVSVSLLALSPNTTYHFRFVATNAGGTSNGADQTFTTLANTCATDSSLCPPSSSGSSSSSSGPAPSITTPAPAPVTPKALKCKKGFKRKIVKGKAKCVKVRAKKHRKARRDGRGR